MSSSVTIVYGSERTVSIKTTPTTTLHAVLNSACEKIPGSLNPESQALVYNGKVMDLSLTIRFANLPQNARLKLISRSSAASIARIGSSSTINRNRNAASNSPKPQPQKKHALDGPVKVALQVVGSDRVIGDYAPSTTLWDVLTTTEAKSGGALNLTKRFRVPESGSLSPIEKGLNYLSGMISRASGSGNNSETEEARSGANTPRPVYQQPVLVVLNKEFSVTDEMQATSLKSLGFAGGSSVMMRLSFKDSATGPLPSSSPSVPQPTITLPFIPAPMDRPLNSEALGISTPAVSDSKKIKQEPIVELIPQQSTPNTNEGDRELLTARQVHVYDKPSDSASGSVASRIVLPESFYDDDDSSSDLKLLISIQRSRQAESERGFRSRIKQEQEEEQKHQQLKEKFSKTAIRFRFPDMVQVQATFMSSDKVEELFRFVREIMAVPQAMQSLFIQPPVQDLGSMLGVTLFDAKLTPAAVVHVRLQQGMSAKVATSDLLKRHVWDAVETLDVPVSAGDISEHESEPKEKGSEQISTPATVAATSSPVSASPSTSSPASNSNSDNRRANADSGPRMPKWFLAGQRRA
ncbi:hypothetical protein LPJ73_000228 [Coemansia sp. RSA 2703]|nr:hypothetical protein LPJ73_000228 [Coemansia sp. RSA 2703]KAJ2379209.1 hypothetical protein IW150_000318 [Coemansia sp. RSA 2607]KAJ2398299.1 hypothetical protein GGI05_000171 [Coemansia sp. RSA 2603]